jgi:hypothetical protein
VNFAGVYGEIDAPEDLAIGDGGVEIRNLK